IHEGGDEVVAIAELTLDLRKQRIASFDRGAIRHVEGPCCVRREKGNDVLYIRLGTAPSLQHADGDLLLFCTHEITPSRCFAPRSYQMQHRGCTPQLRAAGVYR